VVEGREDGKREKDKKNGLFVGAHPTPGAHTTQFYFKTGENN